MKGGSNIYSPIVLAPDFAEATCHDSSAEHLYLVTPINFIQTCNEVFLGLVYAASFWSLRPKTVQCPE